MSEQRIDIAQEITNIECSPNLKYVVTWNNNDMSIHVKDEKIKDFSKAEKYELKISDQKVIALIPYNGHNAALITFPQRMKILEPYDNRKEIIEYNFIVREDCHYIALIRGDKNFRGTNNAICYIYDLVDLVNLDRKPNKTIIRISEYNYSKDNIVINYNGYIFIFKHDTHIIMVWDILTLEFIVTLPTEWDVCCTGNLVINDERTLLAIWFKESVYIYSVDLQLLLSFNKFGSNIENCHFLLFKEKECLLIICEQKEQIHLLDPYNKGKGTMETLKLSQPYIIKHNIVFYIDNDNKLKVRNLFESLKDNLKNMNSKLVAKGVLNEIKEESGSSGLEFNDEGELKFNDEEWYIKKIGSNKILLSYNTSNAEGVLKEIKEKSQESKSEDKLHIKKIDSDTILLYFDEPDIKIKIKLLESKDLLMITTNAIFIWTGKPQNIRLHYFRSYEKNKFESFQKNQKEYLPYLFPPEFKIKIEDCYFNELMEEMIKDYIDSRFKLSLYGTNLMQYLLENQKFDFIEMILENIIKFTIQNSDRNFISNLPLMKIVTYNFNALVQYPEIINLFLSRIAFFVPDDILSEIVNKNSNSMHLQTFGTYPNVSEISIIYLKIENFFNFFSKFSLRIKQKLFKQTKSTVKLVFPLMGLTNYYNIVSYGGKKKDIKERITQFLAFFINLMYLSNNPFLYSPETDLYKFWIGEALIIYKWDKFGMIYHFIIRHNLLVTFVIIATLFCIIEARYFSNMIFLLPYSNFFGLTGLEEKRNVDNLIKNKDYYFRNYNKLKKKLNFQEYVIDHLIGLKKSIQFILVDWLASVFVMATAISTIQYKNSEGWLIISNNVYVDLGAYITLTILLLEFKILFNLHVYELFGIQFAIIFDELRKIVKQIQNDDWPGTYKPFIPDTLLKAIHMSNENSKGDKNNDEYDEWHFYQ
ncbi:30618_t:CDS:2 [Gigaspora margarita]|uniref:30618_t:CDS:1 n=1 Tax=Gigaspora margarita TaxID=4874 RepID=A0ABN7UQB5_GIGMA|nr:30618_t:CDS:2 [Gigaspora margarita]